MAHRTMLDTSSGWRVAQSSEGIAWPFLARGDAGSYPPSKASGKGQEDESRAIDSGVGYAGTKAHKLSVYIDLNHRGIGDMAEASEHLFRLAEVYRGEGEPRALAVLRLMTSSNFVGRKTGRSAGFAPARILPV